MSFTPTHSCGLGEERAPAEFSILNEEYQKGGSSVQLLKPQLIPNGQTLHVQLLMEYLVYSEPTLNIQHKPKHNFLFKY